MNLLDQLRRDEGERKFPYVDTVGKTTIGVGRNLSDKGLSLAEIDFLLQNDVDEVEKSLTQFSWYTDLDDVRQAAVANMCFNLGLHGLLGFPSAIHFLSVKDYDSAAEQIMDSLAARQLPARYGRIAEQIRTGNWQ